MEAVFGTTELLELILLNLAIKDLILAKRICKSWRNTIQASDSIQKALGYKPIAPAAHTPNRSLLYRLSFDEQDFLDSDADFVVKSTSTSALDFLTNRNKDKIYYNPVLVDIFFATNSPVPERVTPGFGGSPRAVPLRFAYKPFPAKYREHFDKYLLTQPPVTDLVFRLAYDHRTGDFVSLSSTTGITIGDLIDKISRIGRSDNYVCGTNWQYFWYLSDLAVWGLDLVN